MARTGLFYHQDMLRHDTGAGHPERATRVEAVRRALDGAGLDLRPVPGAMAEVEDLCRIHTREHVATIERTCASGGVYPDPDTPMGPGSWEAARRAAGGSIAACRAVMEKSIDNAFCLIRPPGHHAESDHAMGFCLFNNVAIAARRLQAEMGIRRIAILDWDVHHGNGTQHAFYTDDTVYYVSLHQHPLYPGTGRPDERGANDTNLNIPFPPGTAGDAWVDAIRDRVVPELERFAPEFLLVSAGFDAHRLDPLGQQQLDAEHYVEMTRLTAGLAGGRVVSLLEGGYHQDALAECAVAHVRALQACASR